jgi:two-component sensor histidine kinase
LVASLSAAPVLARTEAEGPWLQQMLNASSDCIAVLDAAGCISFINEAGLRALQLDAAAAQGQPWYRQWPEAEAPRQALVAAAGGRPARFQAAGRSPAERPGWWDVQVDPVRDSSGQVVQMLAIGRDITARVEQDRRQALLTQEANHRVKNGLQMVQSLLSLRSRTAEEPAASELKSGAARVHSISLLHDQLRSVGDGRAVETDAYLQALMPHLRSSLAGSSGRDIVLEHADSALWQAGELTTLGLVLVELTTNALQHGRGTVTIAFRQPPGQPATLAVTDDGEAAALAGWRPALGLQMAQGLLAAQGGTLALDAGHPKTRFVAAFPLPGEEPD